MPGERCRLAGDALHHAAVAAQREDAIVEQLETGPVEVSGEPIGADRQADAGGDALAERAGRGFHARGPMILGMTRALAVELSEFLQIVERDRRGAEPLVFLVDRFDAGQVQHRIKQRRGMARGQDKTIAVRPDRIIGIEPQEFVPQRVHDRRHRHRRAFACCTASMHKVRIVLTEMSSIEPVGDAILCSL